MDRQFLECVTQVAIHAPLLFLAHVQFVFLDFIFRQVQAIMVILEFVCNVAQVASIVLLALQIVVLRALLEHI